MTRAQERKVAALRREAEHDDPRMEIKKFEVNEYEGFVSVIIETGYPGDEGTVAQVLFRRSAHVFIGKRGGMEIPVSRFLKNGKFRHYYKKYRSFLATHIEQNHRWTR